MQPRFWVYEFSERSFLSHMSIEMRTVSWVIFDFRDNKLVDIWIISIINILSQRKLNFQVRDVFINSSLWRFFFLKYWENPKFRKVFDYIKYDFSDGLIKSCVYCNIFNVRKPDKWHNFYNNINIWHTKFDKIHSSKFYLISKGQNSKNRQNQRFPKRNMKSNIIKH